MNFHIYRDHEEKYRWRLKAGNGEIIADSGQGYASKQHCKEAIEKVQASMHAGVVDEVGPRIGEIGT